MNHTMMHKVQIGVENVGTENECSTERYHELDPALEVFVSATHAQNPPFMVRPYAFSVSGTSSLLALVLMLRIHTNATAHDSGDATREYPPYLIRLDSEYDAATSNPAAKQHVDAPIAQNGYPSRIMVNQILALVPIITSQNQVEPDFPTTSTIVDPTIRPAKESPKARSKRHAGPCFVYGRNLEFVGGSVLQKAAIVVRSKPPTMFVCWMRSLNESLPSSQTPASILWLRSHIGRRLALPKVTRQRTRLVISTTL